MCGWRVLAAGLLLTALSGCYVTNVPNISGIPSPPQEQAATGPDVSLDAAGYCADIGRPCATRTS